MSTTSPKPISQVLRNAGEEFTRQPISSLGSLAEFLLGLLALLAILWSTRQWITPVLPPLLLAAYFGWALWKFVYKAREIRQAASLALVISTAGLVGAFYELSRLNDIMMEQRILALLPDSPQLSAARASVPSLIRTIVQIGLYVAIMFAPQTIMLRRYSAAQREMDRQLIRLKARLPQATSPQENYDARYEAIIRTLSGGDADLQIGIRFLCANNERFATTVQTILWLSCLPPVSLVAAPNQATPQAHGTT